MKHKLYLIGIVAAGVCGGILRGMSLLFGYEAESGLPVEGYMQATALVVLTAVVIAAAALIGRLGYARRKSWRFEHLFGGMPVLCGILCMLCGIGTAGVCAMGIFHLPDQIAEQATLYGDQLMLPGKLIVTATAATWVLGVLSGLCMLVLAVRLTGRRQATRWTGICATIPMFWCCLDLIMVYHENSGNPVLSDYSYLLLLIIAITAAFYSIGSFLYCAQGAAARWYASAGIAVYLAFVNAEGSIMALLRSHTDVSPVAWLGTGNTLRMGAAVMVGLYLLVLLACTLLKKPEEAGTSSDPAAEIKTA